MESAKIKITDISLFICVTIALHQSVGAFYIEESSIINPSIFSTNIQNKIHNKKLPEPLEDLITEDTLLDILNKVLDKSNSLRSFQKIENILHDPAYTEESLPVAPLLQKDNQVDPTTIERLIFEEDIILSSQDELWYLINPGNPFVRSALSSRHKLWPNGVIPYTISDDYSETERGTILKAMEVLSEKTCLRFIPKTDDHNDYVKIFKGSGCSSNVGRIGDDQVISLGNGCVKHGTILHEFMHTAGFWHEQSRYDRDEYVDIVWDNISPKRKFNFNKHSNVRTTSLGLAYDYNSLMHYSSRTFALDRSRPTIIPKDPNAVIGNRKDFSKLDVEGLNKLYNCNIKLPNTTIKPTITNPTTKTAKITTTTTTITTTTTKGTPQTKNLNAITSTTLPPDQSCKDSFTKCQKWTDNGACEKYSFFMMKYCKHSCNVCDKKSCLDDHANCATWAKEGHCSRSSQYMLKYCTRSCDKCDE